MVAIINKQNMNDIDNESVIDSESVKNCWKKIKSAKGVDFFVDKFYQLMFEHHPKFRPFFPENLKIQKSSLLATLDNVINGIEYIDELEDELITLGQRHKEICIKKEMFDDFISTIVATANFASDFSLTDKELVAWEDAFRQVSNIMLKAY
jgi:hemoglobin-like flavoprotein